MSKSECINYIDSAIELLNAMKETLDDDSPDSPLGLLEAAIDAKDQINHALHTALAPILDLSNRKIEG